MADDLRPITRNYLADAPVERTPSYRDRSGAAIRIAILSLCAIAVAGGIAYTQMNQPPAPAPQKLAALTPTPQAPLMQAPSAPPTPMLQAKPVEPAPKAPAARHTKVKAAAPVSDGPTPAPLATSSAAGQTIDVDPKTPQVLTPIPEQVAPPTP